MTSDCSSTIWPQDIRWKTLQNTPATFHPSGSRFNKRLLLICNGKEKSDECSSLYFTEACSILSPQKPAEKDCRFYDGCATIILYHLSSLKTIGNWWWWENGFVILSLHHEFCHWGNDKVWFCHLVKLYRMVMMRKCRIWDPMGSHLLTPYRSFRSSSFFGVKASRHIDLSRQSGSGRFFLENFCVPYGQSISIIFVWVLEMGRYWQQ